MVTIRPATASDVPRIVELVDGMTITSSALQEGRRPTPQGYLDAFAKIEAAPGITVLVAEETAIPASEEAFPVTSTAETAQAVGTTAVVVERLRGQGIGRQIMEYAIDRARQAGCYKIELTSDNRRPEAHRFYSSLGLEAAATGFRLYF